MELIRIDHVSLNVADRPRTVDWYRDILGLGASRGPRPAGQPVFVGPDRAQLGLFADRAPGLRHIALATDRSGQQEVADRLDRLAIPGEFVRHAGHDSIYFRDPDGVTLEVMVPTS
jgi:catechol 2,3-dioxygenase-like lactoylglutathione lyase family enzyme